jgi:hypothetical protein
MGQTEALTGLDELRHISGTNRRARAIKSIARTRGSAALGEATGAPKRHRPPPGERSCDPLRTSSHTPQVAYCKNALIT